METTNSCPVCGQNVKKVNDLLFCENCGFNINEVKEVKPEASTDGENFDANEFYN